MANRDETQNPGGGRAAAPSPSEGGSQHQGGIPSAGGNVKEKDVELESDPAPAEDDIGDDDSEDTSEGDINSAALGH